MTIMLFEDGRWVIDKHQPIETSLDGLVLMLDGTAAGATLAYNGSIWTNGASALYVHETAGENDSVVLDKTYADIVAAVGAGKPVYIAATAEGTTTLMALATFGGSAQAGYTVTAGSATYTATTETGALTKQAEEET